VADVPSFRKVCVKMLNQLFLHRVYVGGAMHDDVHATVFWIRGHAIFYVRGFPNLKHVLVGLDKLTLLDEVQVPGCPVVVTKKRPDRFGQASSVDHAATKTTT
jgi:hypothetical protein